MGNFASLPSIVLPTSHILALSGSRLVRSGPAKKPSPYEGPGIGVGGRSVGSRAAGGALLRNPGPLVPISRRLGHAKPDITLRIYAHLFQKDDRKAATAINALL